MNAIRICVVLLFAVLSVSGLQAELYYWTDENGIKHYSNTVPADRTVRIKVADEISNSPAADRTKEKINEENFEAILDELEKENKSSAQQRRTTPKTPSRQEFIQKEMEKLQEKITYLEQLPPQSFSNMRSRQVIIGKYRYRLQQLMTSPDDYIRKYGTR